MGHKLIFNGFNSEDYGIIISGAGTYATPERDVTSISVPGRNGDIHIDNGRYNNIQVTYEAGIAKGFESKFLPFMNALLSAPLYSRLEDDYHPELYRLATFHAEMVPEVGTILRSGKFNLTFDCKPQRFYKANQAITLSSATAPSFIVAEGTMANVMSDQYKTLMGLTTPNEVVTVLDVDGMYQETFVDDTYKIYAYYADENVGKRLVHGESEKDPTTASYTGGTSARILLSDNVWSYSLSERYIYFTTPLYWRIVNETQGIEVASLFTAEKTITTTTRFSANPLIKIDTTGTALTGQAVAIIDEGVIRLSVPASISVYGQSVAINEVYIDCETMDAYMYKDEAKISLNKYVTLPDEDLTIKNGSIVKVNGFITSLEISPRWWVL